jgi:hypothetical protein
MFWVTFVETQYFASPAERFAVKMVVFFVETQYFASPADRFAVKMVVFFVETQYFASPAERFAVKMAVLYLRRKAKSRGPCDSFPWEGKVGVSPPCRIALCPSLQSTDYMGVACGRAFRSYTFRP